MENSGELLSLDYLLGAYSPVRIVRQGNTDQGDIFKCFLMADDEFLKLGSCVARHEEH